MLLAGVVAVNVAVLRLNLQLDEVGRERTELKTDIARPALGDLEPEAATSGSSASRTASSGSHEAEPEDTTYIQLGR